jgi:acetyltransferase-like isoleucine patch superfamily enzyme
MRRTRHPQKKREMSRSQAIAKLKAPKASNEESVPPSKIVGDISFGRDLSYQDPKILIATPMWKRHHIFEFWAERMKPFGCDILVVGSEGEVSKNLVEKYGFIYLERPNTPLGAKFNARAEYFLDNDQYTHLVLVGSDDIICPKAFRLIENHISRYDIISWMDCYYYEWKTGKIAYMPGFKGERAGEPMAPGRCISRRVVEHMGSQMWSSQLKRYPDGNLWKKLRRYANQIHLSCRENDCAIVDIKSDFNLNSMDSLFRYKLAKLSDSIEVRRLIKNIRIGENVLIGKNVEIGEGTVIMNNVEIRNNVKIGKNCYVDSGVCITGDAEIGDNVILRNYVVVARGSKVGDNSFLAPRVMFNNLDAGQKKIGGAIIGKNCFIGTNTVLHHGIQICDDVNIGALSFVNRNITQKGTYVGQPAKKI